MKTKPNACFSERRRCILCNAILSIYNPLPICWSHRREEQGVDHLKIFPQEKAFRGPMRMDIAYNGRYEE